MHKPFLLAALKQAWLGRGICAPNPAVGAVIVRDKKIIAQAYHQGPGTAHAEQLLLRSLPKNINDLSLYVTLEPCNHWGRTPPCTSAIIEYGIKKVIYAYHDPNPLVSRNNTAKLLKDKGIEVIYEPIKEIEEFYKSYHYWMRNEKPVISAKIAQSLDGKIAGKNGERIILSNVRCQEFTHKKRLFCDAILTTACTINQDDPLLNVRLKNHQNVKKNIIILDARNELNPEAKILKSSQVCHIYYDKKHKITHFLANCIYHPVNADNNSKLDLKEIILSLGKLGFHDIWIEAGGKLFGALHKLQLVNFTYIYITPKILGEGKVLAYPVDDILKLQDCDKLNWQAMDDNMILSIYWNTTA